MPLPSIIQQAPTDQGVSVEVGAWAVIPHDRKNSSLQDIQATPSCKCEGCTRSGARLLRLGDQTSLYTTNVYGTGENPFEEVSDMFRTAERLLKQCGMDFRNVVRSWIYLRDIDRDYHALNDSRREFFQRSGIEMRPASTGVQGIPFPDAHDFSMSLFALRAPRLPKVTGVSTPTLNEAWRYGADFSRAVKVVEANKVALYVSGTASIDDAGRSVHIGNFEAQADRMLHNIASLLAGQGGELQGYGFRRCLSEEPE